jgi:hypothetical protein
MDLVLAYLDRVLREVEAGQTHAERVVRVIIQTAESGDMDAAGLILQWSRLFDPILHRLDDDRDEP